MANLDITLRDIISNIPQKFIKTLTKKEGVKILDNTFPSTKERKADLVLELEDGSIFHLELQTQNDKNMPFRMLEYYILLKQRYENKPIKQMVLYVGDGKSNMKNSLKVDNLQFHYELKDIKDIECRELLASDSLEDKILAVLCKVEDFEKYIFSLAEDLLKLSEKQRADYIRKLLIALDYRPKLMMKLNTILEERKMPLTITEEMLKQNPFFQKGIEKGIEKGIKEGLKKGKLEAKKEDIIKIYKKLNLSPKDIAEVLELPEDFVKKVIQELIDNKEAK